MKTGNKALCAALALLLTAAFPAAAQEPYDNYSFSWHQDYDVETFPYVEPQAYRPEAVITGSGLGLTAFNNPRDVAIGPSGEVYIADTNNNRVIRLDAGSRAAEVIESAVIDGKPSPLAQPHGLFAAPDGSLLIADTGNARVLLLDADRTCRRVYETPRHRLIPEGYAFKPVSAAMDKSGRVYVVSQGENQGMLEFDKQGAFKGFMGAIEVASPGFLASMWKLLRTDEQQKRTSSWIPTEYNGIDIDASGFVYGTVSAIDDQKNFVRRLNPMGVNILNQDKEKPVAGDLFYATENGEDLLSKMVDVSVGGHGAYSVLDERKGRVFTYDSSGSLLFVFGGLGDGRGSFSQPVALDTDERQRVYVVDAKYNQIVVFSPTEYARLVLSAVEAQSERRFEDSEDAWAKALQYSVHSGMPYIGMGKVLMRQKQYQGAMQAFKAAHATAEYGEAYKLYRQDVMRELFPYLVTGAAALLLFGVLAVKLGLFRRLRRKFKR